MRVKNEMKKSDINNFRNNHYIGQRLKVPKVLSNEKTDMVSGEILKIYTWHCLVKQVPESNYKWCVKWVDLMMLGVK